MRRSIERLLIRGTLLQSRFGLSVEAIRQVSSKSSKQSWINEKKHILAALGIVTGGVGALVYALDSSVKADEMVVHPPKQHWSHRGIFSSLDHASIRRGYEVYKSVCIACHSMNYLAYRNLVGVSHTEEEAKAEAEDQTIRDGPNDVGEYFDRPGKLSDYFPNPYPNEEAARDGNNGSLPPDLSYIAAARHGGEDYLFALLTGYCDPPAGVNLKEGLHYNPYFPGAAIAMPNNLMSEVIEYEDDTPATNSQMAKDVATFLKWASEPEHDERKQMLIKAIGIFFIIIPIMYYMKRHKWTVLKSCKIMYIPRKKC